MKVERFKCRLMNIIKDLGDEKNNLSPELVDIISEEVSVFHQELEIQNEELRRIQRELENKQSHFYSIFDEAPVGYAICDLEGVVFRVNSTFLDMLNLDISDVLNHNLSELVAEDSQDDYYFLFKELKKTENNISKDLFFDLNQKSVSLKTVSNIFEKDQNIFVRMVFIKNY